MLLIFRTNESHREKTCLMTYRNNKGVDQLVHPHSLISTFVVRSLDSIMPALSKSKFQDSEAEQTRLSLTWLEITKDRFSCDMAKIWLHCFFLSIFNLRDHMGRRCSSCLSSSSCIRSSPIPLYVLGSRDFLDRHTKSQPSW